MSTTTKPEEMQSVEVKSEEMQSVDVKPEKMQPQPKPEMQPEMQPKPPALKPKRFTLKPSKRSDLKPIQLKRSVSDIKLLQRRWFQS